jgi:hypothetical protein
VIPSADTMIQAGWLGAAVALATLASRVQITARLTHPNTVAVYDYGRTLGGSSTTRWSTSRLGGSEPRC